MLDFHEIWHKWSHRYCLLNHEEFFLKKCCIFELRFKIPWLAAPWLPWQPIKKSGFMIQCVLFPCTLPPNMNTMGYFVFELHSLPVLANQRPCSVTMVTRVKKQMFFKTRHHGLQYGIQHLSADIWESCVKCLHTIGRFCLNPLLKT